MANGMVKVKREAFERDGGVAVLRDLPRWNAFAETETKTKAPFAALDKKRKQNADAQTNGAVDDDDETETEKEKDVSLSDTERTKWRFLRVVRERPIVGARGGGESRRGETRRDGRRSERRPFFFDTREGHAFGFRRRPGARRGAVA
jgi:hypothetical protein